MGPKMLVECVGSRNHLYICFGGIFQDWWTVDVIDPLDIDMNN